MRAASTRRRAIWPPDMVHLDLRYCPWHSLHQKLRERHAHQEVNGGSEARLRSWPVRSVG